MLKPKSISINLRKREYTTSLLNTSFTTLYKWPQKSHHLYEVFHGSNHQISFVHYTGWMIWAIYWEVTISKQPDQFLRSFGSSTGRAIPCTNCGRKLILGKKELNNAYRFFFMEMKGQVSKKVAFSFVPFKGQLASGRPKGQRRLNRTWELWMKVYLWTFWKLLYKLECWFAVAPRTGWVLNTSGIAQKNNGICFHKMSLQQSCYIIYSVCLL